MSGPVMEPVTKPGNAPIVKVGHTASGVLGSEPMAMAKGEMSNKPMPLDFK